MHSREDGGRGNKTEAEGTDHQIKKSEVPQNSAHEAGEERSQQSSLAPWEQTEVASTWQREARPLEDGRELQA